MNKLSYAGKERRKFIRLEYAMPLDCKICKKETITKLLQGYTANISENGLFCNIKEPVKKNDILWLSFDRGALGLCASLERRAMIYQNGIIGKVVRVEHKKNHTYNVGVSFITREEKNLTHIYPKVHFLKDGILPALENEDNQDNEPMEETKRFDLAQEENGNDDTRTE